MEKVMGGLFLEPATHYKSTMCVIPSGLPILPNLLRYETFAVADYGCMSHMPCISPKGGILRPANSTIPQFKS